MLLVLVTSGCGYVPWPEEFGEVTGPTSRRGINGMAAHRRMWESAGARVLTPLKLSPRLRKIDTIVLIGENYDPPGRIAREWLEEWLSEKEGRTVVYFGRDFNAETIYRSETINEVSAVDRERARTQLAAKQADAFLERVTQIPESTFCRWFYLETTSKPTVHTAFKGPWADQLAGLEGTWPVGLVLEPPEAQFKNRPPSWVAGGTPPKLSPVKSILGNGSSDEDLGDKEIQRSIWRPDEIDDTEAWDSEWELAGQGEVLLAGQDNTPLVFRVTHESFEGSQILIAANGAPFLNGSIVKPLHQKISELVIRECMPAKRVAMIRYDQTGLLISNIDVAEEANFGMELMTVWPLSAITMHAALLGILAFAVLLPILGRPQKLRDRSVTNFGLHIEALGRMLSESRDLQFGLKSITEYFTKVRREAPPEWLNEMVATKQPIALRSKQRSKREKPPPRPNLLRKRQKGDCTEHSGNFITLFWTSGIAAAYGRLAVRCDELSAAPVTEPRRCGKCTPARFVG